MSKRFFKKWNWEYDFGEGEILGEAGPVAPPVVAQYDHRGMLYRVETVEGTGAGEDAKVRFLYDYFCDDSGNVLEKRSLDTSMDVALIVRFVYGKAGAPPTQVAFSPESGETRSIIVRDYLGFVPEARTSMLTGFHDVFLGG